MKWLVGVLAVTLSWQYDPGAVAVIRGFVIERSKDSAPFARRARTTTPTVWTYKDNVNPGQAVYCYRVRAYKVLKGTDLASAPSNVACEGVTLQAP